MKYYLLPIALLMMLSYSFGQNSAEDIRSKENKELLVKLLKIENEAEQRILSYLQVNPQVQRHISKENGGSMSLYDIIEGKPVYMGTTNLDAARATGVTDLQVGGSLGLDLDGTGMTVLVWDGGPVQTSHVEFMDATNTQTRVTNMETTNTDGSTGDNYHATHVTGTISAKGVNPVAKGMATNITIIGYNFNDANSEIISVLNLSGGPRLLSNHSYGLVIEDGGELTVPNTFLGSYETRASSEDAIHKNNPYHLKVVAAGNDGSFSYSGGLFAGIDKLSGTSVAKNNLVIANASPYMTIPFSNEITNLVIHTSSSQGPTDDLRIKPDIAADGTLLTSSAPGGEYGTSFGTSMASPNTTGALALLQQYYEQLHGVYMKSSTIKGLVCHTSRDDIANVGPDPMFGWGFLNAKASAETILDATTNAAVIDELNLAQDETYSFTFSAQAGDKLKATICWTDMPGNLSTGVLNDPTSRLVNDLDLRLSKDGDTFMPWKLDYSTTTGVSNSKGDNLVDNVEIVEIEAPSTGVYTLTVSHKGFLKGNGGGPFDPQTQDFSLIVTGNNLTLGTTDNALSNSLVVYPNPNKGEFTISFDSSLNNSSDVKVDIYDISGRLVYQNSFVNDSSRFNKTINLGSVASGVYIANISSGSNITSQKIIIE